MISVSIEDTTSFSIRVKSFLKKTVLASKRRGAWFSLNRREQSILSLAIRLEVKFSSLDLLRAIASALRSLAEAGNTTIGRIRRGTELAWAFSEFAVNAGNADARSWRNDTAYAEYLGGHMSGHSGRSSAP